MAKNGTQYFFMVQNIKITVHSSNFYINVIFTVSIAEITVHSVKCTGTHRNFSSATANYPNIVFSVQHNRREWLRSYSQGGKLCRMKVKEKRGEKKEEKGKRG